MLGPALKRPSYFDMYVKTWIDYMCKKLEYFEMWTRMLLKIYWTARKTNVKCELLLTYWIYSTSQLKLSTPLRKENLNILVTSWEIINTSCCKQKFKAKLNKTVHLSKKKTCWIKNLRLLCGFSTRTLFRTVADNVKFT